MTLTVKVLMENFDATMTGVANNIDTVFDKQWEARADVTRTVVSVAAVIFAGTVVLLEKDAPRHGTLQGACLIASWLLLSVSIGAGLYALWKMVALRSFHSALFNQKPYLEDQFMKLNLSAPNVVAQSMDIIRQVADSVTNPMGTADKHAQIGASACLLAFGGSMLLFLVYALAKLGVLCN